LTVLVAEVAVETGISPVDLLDAPPEVFWAMVAVLRERAEKARKGDARGR
jgi:hypothetical protein